MSVSIFFQQVIAVFAYGTSMCERTVGLSFALAILALALLFTVTSKRKQPQTMTVSDFATAALLLFLLLSSYFSIAHFNTIHFITPFTIGVCLYNAMRLFSRFPSMVARAYAFVGNIVGGLFTACSLWVEVHRIHEANKLFLPWQLSSIRYAIPLIPIGTKNDILLLQFMIFTCALGTFLTQPRRSGIRLLGLAVGMASLTALLLGFSRAIYLALIVEFFGSVVVALLTSRRSKGRIAVFWACTSVAALMVVLSVHSLSAVTDTALLGHTLSQQDSLRGRTGIWKETLIAMNSHLWMGTGGGTAGYQALARLSNTNAPFAARSYNALLEMASQTGLIGLLLYGCLLLPPFYILVRKRSASPFAALTAVALCAIFVRELSYSSMVLYGPVVVWVLLLVGVLNNDLCRSDRFTAEHKIFYPVALAFVVLAAGLWTFGRLRVAERAEDRYVQAVEALQRKDYATARNAFMESARLAPDQPMSRLGVAVSIDREAAVPGFFGKSWLQVLQGANPGQQEAEHNLQFAVDLSGHDAALWSDLAWLQFERGDLVASAASFKKAVLLDPNDAVGQTGFGLFEEQRGQRQHAMELYSRALAAVPRIADSTFYVDLQKRDPDMARDALTAASATLARQTPTPQRTAKLAKLHMAQGRFALAHAEFDQALRMLPNLSGAWADRGLLNIREHHARDAELDLRRALFLDSGDPVALKALAGISIIEGMAEEAEHIDAMIAALPAVAEHATRVDRIYLGSIYI